MPSPLTVSNIGGPEFQGRMTSETHPGGRTRTFTYDVMTRPLTATDETGMTTAQCYDIAERLVSTTRAAATGLARTTTVGYDGAVAPSAHYPSGRHDLRQSAG